MRMMDELKPLYLYSANKRVFAPINPDDKRRNACILLLTPNMESSSKLMKLPYIYNPNYFRGFFIDRNVMAYIDNGGMEDVEELDEREEEAVSEALVRAKNNKTKITFDDHTTTMDRRYIEEYINQDQVKEICNYFGIVYQPETLKVRVYPNMANLRNDIPDDAISQTGNAISSFTRDNTILLLSRLYYDPQTMGGPYNIYIKNELICAILHSANPDLPFICVRAIASAVSGQSDWINNPDNGYTHDKKSPINRFARAISSVLKTNKKNIIRYVNTGNLGFLARTISNYEISAIRKNIFESTLSYADRQNLLPSDFGVPSKRKYPMPDPDHVRAAIRMFNNCDPDDEKELAQNILKKMKKFGIADVKVSAANRFKKYYQPEWYKEQIKSYKHEATIINRKDIESRLDEWKPGKKNILYILGNSGSGKTTQSKKLVSENNAILVSLDYIEELLQPDAEIKNLSVKFGPDDEYEPFRDYYRTHKKLVDELSEKYKNDSFSGSEYEDYVDDIFKYLVSKAKANSRRLYIFEGISLIDFVEEYGHASEILTSPIIIKQTSALTSAHRAIKRNSNGYKSISKIFKRYKFSVRLDKEIDKFIDAFYRYNPDYERSSVNEADYYEDAILESESSKVSYKELRVDKTGKPGMTLQQLLESDIDDDSDVLNEGYLISHDYTCSNLEKWNTKENNVLYITGLMGSGKTTIASSLAKDPKVIRISLDYLDYLEFLRNNRDDVDHEMKKCVDLMLKYADDIGYTKDPLQAPINEYYEWLKGCFGYILNYARKDKNHKYVIEGIQILYLMDLGYEEEILNSPVIINNISMVKSIARKIHRDGLSDFSISNIFYTLRWYCRTEKDLRKLRGKVRNLTESGVMSEEDEKFLELSSVVDSLSNYERSLITFDDTYKNSSFVIYRGIRKINGNPAGFIDVYQFPTRKDIAQIVIAVDPKYRELGIANSLVREMLDSDLPKEFGFNYYYWTAHSTNLASQELARKNGFTDTGRVDQYNRKIFLLKASDNTDEVTYKDVPDFMKPTKLESFFSNDQGIITEDTAILFEADASTEKMYSSKLRKYLYRERIKNNRQVMKQYEKIKEMNPEILYTYPRLDLYKKRNIFVDLSYYHALFLQKNQLRLDRAVRFYFDFLNRLINNPDITSQYATRTVFIPIDSGTWNEIPGTDITDYKKNLNPISIIFRLIRTNLNALRTAWGGKSIIFVGSRGYFTIDFSTVEIKNLPRIRTNLKKLMSASDPIVDEVDGDIGDDDDDNNENVETSISKSKDTEAAMATKMIDKIEKKTNIEIDDISAATKPKKETSERKVATSAMHMMLTSKQDDIVMKKQLDKSLGVVLLGDTDTDDDKIPDIVTNAVTRRNKESIDLYCEV